MTWWIEHDEISKMAKFDPLVLKKWNFMVVRMFEKLRGFVWKKLLKVF